MPKTLQEKRLNAIAGYEASIARWNRNMAGATDPEKVKVALDKIAKHERAIAHTKAALNRY